MWSPSLKGVFMGQGAREAVPVTRHLDCFRVSVCTEQGSLREAVSITVL